MKKNWFNSMTFWGALIMFIGAGLEAFFPGFLPTLIELMKILGVPLIGFGIRRAIK